MSARSITTAGSLLLAATLLLGTPAAAQTPQAAPAAAQSAQATRPDAPSRFPSARERAWWRDTVKVLMTRPSCCGGCQNSFSAADLAAVREAISASATDTPHTREVWASWSPRLLFMVSRDPRLQAEYHALRASEKETSR